MATVSAPPPYTLAYYEQIPLIQPEIVQELFAPEFNDDPEMEQIRRELWEGLQRDLLSDLYRVMQLIGEDSTRAQGQKEAHRLAGYAGNSGLQRMGVVLRDLQHERIPAEELPHVLEHLPSWAEESLASLQKHFPLLGQ